VNFDGKGKIVEHRVPGRSIGGKFLLMNDRRHPLQLRSPYLNEESKASRNLINSFFLLVPSAVHQDSSVPPNFMSNFSENSSFQSDLVP